MKELIDWLYHNFDNDLLLFFAVAGIIIFAFGSLSLVAIALFAFFAISAFKILAICTGAVAMVATLVLLIGTASHLLE